MITSSREIVTADILSGEIAAPSLTLSLHPLTVDNSAEDIYIYQRVGRLSM